MGAAGGAPGVPRAYCGLGTRAAVADRLHMLARLDLADRAVSAPLTVRFLWHFGPVDGLEPRLYRPPAGGAGHSCASAKLTSRETGPLFSKKRRENFA